jgi:hypothetical protein
MKLNPAERSSTNFAKKAIKKLGQLFQIDIRN